MSRSHLQHADESELRCLVFGDENSDEYRVAATHVETCRECQSRLNQVANAEELSGEIGELLSGLDDERTDRTAAESLEFLASPSHPEMLGRLGRYEVERVIGSGGMGIVLKGFDTELHRPVAIKVLAGHLSHSGAARQRFAREARAAAAVVHEHVVAIHNVETSGKVPFLVMHFIAGESLQARVDRTGPLTTTEVLRIGIQAAAGLAAAHEQGVVHRDIKPANILLENGVERVLLTDFGLARTVDDASLTHTGIVAGTPHYMSPEQANGQTTDHRTDLFSLGSVLYFMATGRPPFRAERAMGVLHRICHDTHRPVWEVNSAIPDELSDIIDRLLEKKPSCRFSDATAVKDALTQLLARIQQRGPRRRSGVVRVLRRHPRLIAAIATGAVAIVLAIPFLQSSVELPDSTSQQRAETTPNNAGAESNSASNSTETTTASATPSLEAAFTPFVAETQEFTAERTDIEQRLNRLDFELQATRFAPPTNIEFQRLQQSIESRLKALDR